MKKLRARPVFRKPLEEFRAPACEVCGAPYKARQILNLPVPKGDVPYGAYVQDCTCERPAPKVRPNDPTVPF